MLGGIVTPLILPDEDCNPEGLQCPSGNIYILLGYNFACLRVSDKTNNALFCLSEYLTSTDPFLPRKNICLVFSFLIIWWLKALIY